MKMRTSNHHPTLPLLCRYNECIADLETCIALLPEQADEKQKGLHFKALRRLAFCEMYGSMPIDYQKVYDVLDQVRLTAFAAEPSPAIYIFAFRPLSSQASKLQPLDAKLERVQAWAKSMTMDTKPSPSLSSAGAAASASPLAPGTR